MVIYLKRFDNLGIYQSGTDFSSKLLNKKIKKNVCLWKTILNPIWIFRNLTTQFPLIRNSLLTATASKKLCFNAAAVNYNVNLKKGCVTSKLCTTPFTESPSPYPTLIKGRILTWIRLQHHDCQYFVSYTHSLRPRIGSEIYFIFVISCTQRKSLFFTV